RWRSPHPAGPRQRRLDPTGKRLDAGPSRPLAPLPIRAPPVLRTGFAGPSGELRLRGRASVRRSRRLALRSRSVAAGGGGAEGLTHISHTPPLRCGAGTPARRVEETPLDTCSRL